MNQSQINSYLSACEILQVDPMCELELAAKFYLILMKKYHPDRPGGDTNMCQKINDAHDVFKKFRPLYSPTMKQQSKGYSQQQSEEKQTHHQQHTESSSSGPRPHDIYADVMGFQINLSSVGRAMLARQREVAARKKRKL